MSLDILKKKENAQFLSQFKSFLKNHLNTLKPLSFKGHKQLKEALEYSLFSGGKYFRPLLAHATAEIFSIKSHEILPWAASIEMIHTASLIHDDLPAMDNAHERRGKASSHRRFGEDLALLAGDTLWIEAFKLLYFYKTNKKAELWLPILCEAVGFQGLMGGQALDLKPPHKPDTNYYHKMHSWKTGALIAASVQGVSVLAKDKEKINRVNKAALFIGEAFQLADDLQDKEELKPCNSTFVIGRKEVEQKLRKLSLEASKLIDFDELHSGLLKELIHFNQERGLNASN